MPEAITFEEKSKTLPRVYKMKNALSSEFPEDEDNSFTNREK